jgi:hypothetical protein
MPYRDVLIMAMTRMRSGICTAGFVNESHPASQLAWVRPVKEFGSLLIGDMSDASNRVIEIGDVAELNLIRPRPEPVHSEDWLTDFVRQRPRLVRHLHGQKRADFLAAHLDLRPADVLHDHSRSLCLLEPQEVWANFQCDEYSGEYQARLGFQLANQLYPALNSQRGIPVTDLKWRALGRHWLAEDQRAQLYLDHTALYALLNANALYLSIGLSRSFEGKIWPLVIGVHPVPDYTIAIDYDRL